MNTKIGPVAIGAAIVALLAFCIFMYVRANRAAEPNQLPPGNATFKPGYDGGGSNAGPHNRQTRPKP